jgi:hypothetical protein
MTCTFLSLSFANRNPFKKNFFLIIAKMSTTDNEVQRILAEEQSRLEQKKTEVDIAYDTFERLQRAKESDTFRVEQYGRLFLLAILCILGIAALLVVAKIVPVSIPVLIYLGASGCFFAFLYGVVLLQNILVRNRMDYQQYTLDPPVWPPVVAPRKPPPNVATATDGAICTGEQCCDPSFSTFAPLLNKCVPNSTSSKESMLGLTPYTITSFTLVPYDFHEEDLFSPTRAAPFTL